MPDTIDYEFGEEIPQVEEKQQEKTKEVDPKEKVQEVEATVSQLVGKLKKGASQEELLEEYDPAIVYAAVAEKRRRDTQAEYTKTRQEYKATLAEKEKLEELIANEVVNKLDIDDDKREELETLKLVDPDAWRQEINRLEEEQKTLSKKKIKELTEEAKQAVLQEEMLAQRERELEEFYKTHPDLEITDELIENEIPPKYVKDLENGNISFTEFLEKVYNFVKGPKAVKNEAPQKEGVDLSQVPGGASPDEASKAEDIFEQYDKMTF